MNRFLIALIRLYRRFISPVLPQACRFTPTCSEYAIEAFEKKGALRAIWMTGARLAKCHPFHPGGYDPVDPVCCRHEMTGPDTKASSPVSESGAGGLS